MLQRDYLVQLISQFIQAIIRAGQTAVVNPKAAADSLEEAIANATDIDGAMLLSLGGESMAQVMELSGVDPRVAGYIAHSLDLEADYLDQAGEGSLAALRRQQAQCITSVYGLNREDIAAELDQDISDSLN